MHNDVRVHDHAHFMQASRCNSMTLEVGSTLYNIMVYKDTYRKHNITVDRPKYKDNTCNHEVITSKEDVLCIV
jgi:hypothetical protein